MKAGHGPTSERLYTLIDNLSKREKLQFWSYISSTSKGQKEKYTFIFESFSASKSFNPSSIVKKVFKGDQEAFANSCRYLEGKIVEALARYENSDFNALAMISKAIDLGSIKIAHSLLKKEFVSAQGKCNLDFLIQLYEYYFRLKTHYKKEICLPSGLPEYNQLLLEQEVLAKSKRLYNSFAPGFRLDPEGKRKFAQEVSDDVYSLGKENRFPVTIVSVLKTKVRWHRFKGDLYEAANCQAQLVAQIKCHQACFGPERYIQELGTLFFFQVNEDAFSDAEKTLLEVGMVDVSHQAAEDLLLETWIKSAILLSVCSGKPGLGDRGIRDFQKHEALFSSRWRAIVSYWISVKMFSEGAFEEAMEWTSKFMRLSKSSREGLEPFSHMVKILSLIEQGRLVDANRVLEKQKGQILATESKYLALCISVLEIASQGVSKSKKRAELSRLLPEIEETSASSNEAVYRSSFNILPWIDSFLADTTIQNRPKKDSGMLLSFKMVS